MANGASPQILERRLRDDIGGASKAVIVVHNETSTGVVSSIRNLRQVMNQCDQIVSRHGRFAELFRIGHLGWFNELMLAGTISGVELGLRRAGVPFKQGGILATLGLLSGTLRSSDAVPLVR